MKLKEIPTKDAQGRVIHSFYNSKNQVVKMIFTVDEELTFMESKDSAGNYTGIYDQSASLTTNTYIAQQERKQINNKRRNVFSLYKVTNIQKKNNKTKRLEKARKNVLIARFWNPQKVKRGFETNLDQVTGFRRMRIKEKYQRANKNKHEYSDSVDLITSDRAVKVYRWKAGLRQIAHPQMIAKVKVHHKQNKYPDNIMIAYSSSQPVGKSLAVIERALAECVNMALVRYMDLHGIPRNMYNESTGKDDEGSGKNVSKDDERENLEAVVLAWRWQYWAVKKPKSIEK